MKKKALLVARSLAALKPGAVNVGRNDLAAGMAFVMEVGKASGLPWLSSNIRLPDGSAPFPTFKRLKWGELTVVVVAATPANPRLDKGAGIKVLDPTQALRAALAEAGDADVVIALSDLGYSEEHALAKALTQIDIIVGGGSGQRLLKEPLKLGKTLLLRVADRGRQLGVFDLGFSKPFKWGTPTSMAETTGGSAALEAFGQQLALARNSTPAKDDPVLKTLQLLKQRAADKNPAPVGVRYANRVIFLNRSIPDDPAVAREIAAFKAAQRAASPTPTPRARVRKLIANAPTAKPFKAAQVKKKIGRLPSPPKALAPAKAPAAKAAAKKASWYLGTMKCRTCHQPQYAKWNATGHSRAGSLLSIDKMADPKCRSCHTARLDLARGVSSEGFVGCESCHGQGSGHPEKMRGESGKDGKAGTPKIARKVAPEVCLACHRGEHHEIFVLEQDYQKVRCDR